MASRNLSDQERERRRQSMIELHRRGLTRSALAGRPRRGETAAQARARRERELAEREREASEEKAPTQETAPLPARPVAPPPAAPEPASGPREDERIARALAAAGHTGMLGRGEARPGSRSPWLSRGAGPANYP